MFVVRGFDGSVVGRLKVYGIPIKRLTLHQEFFLSYHGSCVPGMLCVRHLCPSYHDKPHTR